MIVKRKFRSSRSTTCRVDLVGVNLIVKKIFNAFEFFKFKKIEIPLLPPAVWHIFKETELETAKIVDALFFEMEPSGLLYDFSLRNCNSSKHHIQFLVVQSCTVVRTPAAKQNCKIEPWRALVSRRLISAKISAMQIQITKLFSQRPCHFTRRRNSRKPGHNSLAAVVRFPFKAIVNPVAPQNYSPQWKQAATESRRLRERTSERPIQIATMTAMQIRPCLHPE